MTKLLEEAARERTVLTGQHYDEMEHAKLALNRVQTTYQTQLMEYGVQAQATVGLIKKLKEEKQVVEYKSKMGLSRIRVIVLAWNERTKSMIGESLVQWWSKWAQQTTELQTLQADVKNQRKDGDNIYKMDAESIVTIREELSNDFLSLAGEQLVVVRRLVEQLDDDQFATQLQFE